MRAHFLGGDWQRLGWLEWGDGQCLGLARGDGQSEGPTPPHPTPYPLLPTPYPLAPKSYSLLPTPYPQYPAPNTLPPTRHGAMGEQTEWGQWVLVVSDWGLGAAPERRGDSIETLHEFPLEVEALAVLHVPCSLDSGGG